MKTALAYLITGTILLSLMYGCGPSEEELREQQMARQQATQDSLALVYEQQMEQMRLDSLEQARQDSIEMAEQEPDIVYSEDGEYVVQIEAWRSESKANSQAERWKERGFNHVFVVEYGDDDSGELWYRVRFGRFDTKEMAETLQQNLLDEYQKESWVSILYY